MHPAFRSTRSAVGMAAGILALLLMPIVIKGLGLPPREEVWKSVPTGYGPIGRVVWTIYHDRTDPDILFLGTSRTLEAVDDPRLEAALSEKMGRPVTVRTLGLFHDGLDLEYVMLRDYLERHHPKVVMLEVPGLSAANSPHLFLSRWLRLGEDQDAFSGLTARNRIQIYGEMVLGSSRQLVNLLRPNQIGEEEQTLAGQEAELGRISLRGFLTHPFVEDHLPTLDKKSALRVIPEEELQKSTAHPGPYAAHFVNQIGDLVARQKAKLILFRSPSEDEYGQSGVPEMSAWVKALSQPPSVLWMSSSRLFGREPRSRVDNFYADVIHLNKNGTQLFTEAIVPSMAAAINEASHG